VRVFGLTVGRNEADRYLEPMLWHMHSIVDGHFFFDDMSTDSTPEIAAEYCEVAVRTAMRPSFVENEGAFRGNAWSAFEEQMQPVVGDWVLVIDCDEVLVSNHHLVGYASPHRAELLAAIRTSSRVAIDLAIPEVWGYHEGGRPMTRIDGAWGTIHGPRLFAYMPGGDYFQGDFGVPAVPNYVMRGPWDSTDAVSLMHYGYADPRDQLAKYRRYIGRSGHGTQHVQSIVGPVDLEVWHRPYVEEMRRARDC
jgi:hypothetical protein